MRWVVFAPVVLMTLLGAYLGLRQGREAAGVTETEVIARFARRYAEEVRGGRAVDCVGRPGGGRVWLVVDCAPVPFDAARHRRYHVGRDGRAAGLPDGI